MTEGEVWRLCRGGQVVARLHITGMEQPCLYARIERLAGFDALAPLFAEELRLLEAMDGEETPEWDAVYDRIRAETRLLYPDGREVPEYMLHIDGDEAWWRWHDELFDLD